MRISDWSSDVCSSDLAGADDLDLPAGQARAGDRAAGDGDGGRADRRPDPRRLDHRELQLGMDLLHQRADRHLRQLRGRPPAARSEEHTSELQSLMRISYAVFCLKKKILNTIP